MKKILFASGNDYTGLLLRFTAALVLFPHGAQKLLGIFGGYGFTGTMNYFTGTVGLSWIIAFLVIVIEFFAPLFLLAGFGVRIVSGCVIVLLLGIIFSTHTANGFFMNWSGTAAGEGFEYHLLFIGLLLGLIVNGAGKWSVDRKL